MNKISYINRYNDTYTFTLQEDGNILMEGDFKWVRCGWPNVYKEAYEAYRKDGGDMHIEEFKKAVHEYDKETFESSELNKKYASLVYSDTKTINMVDPSGGPYMTSGMDMKYIDEAFAGRIVSSFLPTPTGYLIQTYGEFDHLQDRDIIGGII